MEVKVKIPEELKPWLVDDWDLITRQKQVSITPVAKVKSHHAVEETSTKAVNLCSHKPCRGKCTGRDG